MPGPRVIGEACPFQTGLLLAGLTQGQRLAAQRRGYGFESLDADFSAEAQARAIDELVERGVAALTTWTLDPELAEPALVRAREAGVLLLGFNSRSPSFDAVVRLAADTSAEPAEDAAASIAARIPGARVAVVGPPPVPELVHRTESFLAAAAGHGLEVVARIDNLGDLADPAERAVAELLRRHPALDAIWCFNDPSAIGAGRALRASGRTAWSAQREGVIVVGINGTQEAVDAVAAGEITLTYDANPIEAGAAAIEAIHALLTGARAAPLEVEIGCSRVDASALGRYVPWDARPLPACA